MTKEIFDIPTHRDYKRSWENVQILRYLSNIKIKDVTLYRDLITYFVYNRMIFILLHDISSFRHSS